MTRGTYHRLAVQAAAAGAAAFLALQPLRAQEAVEMTHVAVGATQRMIVHRADVPAPRDALWEALTTAAGWRTWAVPVAYLDDLRPGAVIETSYRPDAQRGDPANIHNIVVAYLPQRMLAIAATNSPPDFPDRELLASLATVMELEPLGAESTRVTITMMGYGVDTRYDRLFNFFTNGNGATLRQLRERFTTGPVDWAARLR